MKKFFILSAVAALLLSAVSVIDYINNDKNQMNDLFEANVEILAQYEGVTGISRVCAYDEYSWCIYLDPYEEYPGVFVSDVVKP